MNMDELTEIQLPDDVLAEIIFRFVPICQWSSLELVSKQFLYCVLLAFSPIKSFNVAKLFSLKRTIKRGIYSRTISGVKQEITSAILNNVLTKLLSVCPNLTGLFSFERFLSVNTNVETWAILKKFNRLESITLHFLSNSDEIAFHNFADFVASCKSLKHLNVAQNLWDVGGTLDVGSLSSVIIDHRFINNTMIFENFSEKLTSLQMTRFGGNFKSTRDAAKAMAICVNLVSLSVSINNTTDCKILRDALPNLRKLTNLTINNNCPYFEFYVDESFCVRLDSIKSQLQRLTFIGVELSDEMQAFIFTECSHLQSLTLYYVPLSANVAKMLSANVAKMLRHFPAELQTFAVTDRDNSMLPTFLPLLSKLRNFTDLTIIQLASYSDQLENICYLRFLQRLNIDGRFVNDSLLEKWDKKNDKMFGKLISLVMRECEGISEVGGCLLAKKATNLQILDLFRSRIGENTISTLAHFAKKLKEVNLDQAEPLLFDEIHILRLVEKAHRLKKLTINRQLEEKLVQHSDFLPFAENVEINCYQF